LVVFENLRFVPAMVVHRAAPKRQKPESTDIRKKRTTVHPNQTKKKQEIGDLEDLKYLLRENKNNQWLTVEKEISRFQQSLLQWYEKNQRKLPWRYTCMEGQPNPYHVWVSETMLQQTKVATVIEYYKNWLQTFPDITSLAESSLERVNEIWAGLGYYRRAKLLYEGAQTVVSKFGGKIPDDVNLLQSIPGIGPYTAAAIASIAFNRPYAVCDGNVFRVLSRLFCIDLDISSTEGQNLFKNLAQFLLSKERAADYNQAMMELGATVCTPKNFDCEKCPVQSWCSSFQSSTQRQFPVKANRVRQNNEEIQVYLIDYADHFLMLKNVSRNLLGNLWHFPFVTLKRNGNCIPEDEKLSYELYLFRILRSCGYPLKEVDGSQRSFFDSFVPIGQIEHLFTHIKQTIHVKLVHLSTEIQLHLEETAKRMDGGNEESTEYKWFTEGQMEKSAISRQMKKVMELYQRQKKQQVLNLFF